MAGVTDSVLIKLHVETIEGGRMSSRPDPMGKTVAALARRQRQCRRGYRALKNELDR